MKIRAQSLPSGSMTLTGKSREYHRTGITLVLRTRGSGKQRKMWLFRKEEKNGENG